MQYFFKMRSQDIKIYLLFFLMVMLYPQAIARECLCDQLRQQAIEATNPRQRIGLLLDLKDLQVYSKLNIPYSTQLLREAVAHNDTYAMSVAAADVVKYYASYPEHKDSLLHYIRTLGMKTADSPEKGIDAYLQLVICISRIENPRDEDSSAQIAAQVLHWCDTVSSPNKIYYQVRTNVARAYAQTHTRTQSIESTDTNSDQLIASYRKAYEQIGQMSEYLVQHLFSKLIYRVLSDAYLQVKSYDELAALSKEELERSRYYLEQEEKAGRRPYLYKANEYARPYKNLILCMALSGQNRLAQHYFDEFRQRTQHTDNGKNFLNKVWLYEIGSKWHEAAGHYTTSLLYGDSLVNLVEQKRELFGSMLCRSVDYYRSRTALLLRSHRYCEAFETCERTYNTQKSIHRNERHQRAEVIQRKREISRLKIERTESQIHLQFIINSAFTILILLLLWCGILLYKSYRRNRYLQQFIQRNVNKAQESSRMKSAFLNNIYQGIETPLRIIDEETCALITGVTGAAENPLHSDKIRQNTTKLLSILNNILETANINSLAEPLDLEVADIDQICRTELHEAVYNNPNSSVDFRINAPEEACPILTNARYFSFVVHKLLENSIQYTHSGSITLAYHIDRNAHKLTVSVTDTGCGVPPEHRDSLFEINPATQVAAEMSLALCALIIKNLQGEIWLDQTYGPGTRIVFTIPTDL